MTTRQNTKRLHRLVTPILLARARAFIARDGLKLRKAWKVVFSPETGQLEGLPVIEVRRPPAKTYTILSLEDLWHFKNEKDRNLVFDALNEPLTAPTE